MKLVEQFFRIIAPSECLRCGDEGSLICPWCIEESLPAEQSRCFKCNKLTHEYKTCTACRRQSNLKHVWARTPYGEQARQLVHKMKFKYSLEAAELIAREMASCLPALSPDTIIVHVPTITNHVRSRGFDHAKKMASELSKQTGYRQASLLQRMGQHRQVGSRREQRLDGVRRSFRTKSRHMISGSDILLIDDVLTTGATVEEAAITLKRAGAKTISAIIFARAK